MQKSGCNDEEVSARHGNTQNGVNSARWHAATSAAAS